MWKPSTTPNDVLMHSAKGSTWKKHKYIRKEGNKYVYPSNAATQRYKMKQQSKNMKYDEIGDMFDSAYKDRENGTTTNLEEFEIRKKRYKMPTYAASAKRSNYNNQKRHQERFGRMPDSPNLEVLKKKADQSSASAYGFGEKPNAKNKRLTDTGTGGRKIQAKRSVDSAQEAGKKRTEYEKYKNAKAIGAYHTDGSRLADKHMNLAKAANVAANSGYSKGYQTNMEKARQASNVYRGGLARENNDRANTTAYGGDRKSSHSTKVINPTAKKNQQKAKIEKAKYKVKSAINKLKKKLVTEETTVTDAYTGKKRKTNMKANYKKSKKKIRIKK